MMKLNDFEKIESSNFDLKIYGGATCTGGGFSLLRVESIMFGALKRNLYTSWSSDSADAEGIVTLIDESYSYGNWY